MLIKFFLVAILFLTTSCNGQSEKGNSSKIDTALLLNPKPVADELVNKEMFSNCLFLFRKPFAVIIQEQEFESPEYKEVIAKIKSEAELISKQRFYVWIDSSIRFNVILETVNYLKSAQIENYRVINYQEFFTPPEPVKIETPVEVTNTESEDSTYLVIDILSSGCRIKFMNEIRELSNVNSLDEYITKNKGRIKKDKILVKADKNTAQSVFRPYLEFLKKHEYWSFKLMSY